MNQYESVKMVKKSSFINECIKDFFDSLEYKNINFYNLAKSEKLSEVDSFSINQALVLTERYNSFSYQVLMLKHYVYAINETLLESSKPISDYDFFNSVFYHAIKTELYDQLIK